MRHMIKAGMLVECGRDGREGHISNTITNLSLVV